MVEAGRITFDDCKKSYVCKACNKSWFGNKKKQWENHTETQSHKNMINAIKLSGKTNREINQTICYEEWDFGFEHPCRNGSLNENE